MFSPTQLFNCLVIGLQEAALSDPTIAWRYTPQLQRAANALSVVLASQMPVTATAFRHLLSKPLQQWWPASWPIPDAFDPSFGLLEDQLLSEEASAYYYKELVAKAALSGFQPHTVQLAIGNEDFRRLISDFRERSLKEPLQAAKVQQEYVLLRRFLIERPIIPATAIATAFSRTRFVRAQQVGALYETCRGPLWHCEQCGPLLQVNGRQQGIRPSVCSDHLPDRPFVVEVADAPDLRRIRPGIHWRTCFPGKPELFLYQTAHELARQHPRVLIEVELWPGLDQYDLRLRFQDGEIWAVDVKDQRNPHRLGTELAAINGGNELPYNLGFYIIPDRWLPTGSTYLQTVRECAALPESNQLMGMSQFIELLTKRVQVKSKKRRPTK